MKNLLPLALVVLSVLSASAQNVALVRQGTNVVTLTNTPLVFTNQVNASAGLVLPSASNTNTGALWRSTNRLQFLDATNGARTLLNSEDNLSNLASFAAARTNLFSTGGIPSGGAAEGSLYTVVGGQGAWVANRTRSVSLSNSVVVTNNNNLALTNTETALALAVDANSVYSINYSLIISCFATNSAGASAALVSSAGTNGWSAQGVGRALRPNATFQDTQVAAVAAGQGIMLLHQTTGFGSDATNGIFNGFGTFRTGPSNSTLTVRFAQLTSATNPATLHSNSVLTLTKLWP